MTDDVNKRRLSKLDVSPEEEELKQLREENKKLRERVTKLSDELELVKKNFDEALMRLSQAQPVVMPQFPQFPQNPQPQYPQITWYDDTGNGDNIRITPYSGGTTGQITVTGDSEQFWFTNGNNLFVSNDSCQDLSISGNSNAGNGSSYQDMNLYWHPDGFDSEDSAGLIANG